MIENATAAPGPGSEPLGPRVRAPRATQWRSRGSRAALHSRAPLYSARTGIFPVPDVCTDARTMAWFMDAYSSRHGYWPAVVTGKPIFVGGAPGRVEATGRGLAYVLEAYAVQLGWKLDGMRIAVSDLHGGLYNATALGDRIDAAEIFSVECDAFIPAALGGKHHRRGGRDSARSARA